MDKDSSEIETDEVVVLENSELRITLMPQIGGKMVELRCKETGEQFLNVHGDDELIIPQFRDRFDERFAFGFDECFPTVAPCAISNNGSDLLLADHGEVWSRSWKAEWTGESVTLSVDGIDLDYTFHKTIRLSGPQVVIEYSLENNGTVGFDYIWSAHPLLNVEQGDQLLLNSEIKQMMVNWASDRKIGNYGDTLDWPGLGSNGTAETVDWSVVRRKEAGVAVKLFTDRLENGRAGIYKPQTDRSLVFEFNPTNTPYIGLWLCYGGWPQKHSDSYTVAIEPASARPDALSKAVKRGEASSISAGEIRKWELVIGCEKGRAEI